MGAHESIGVQAVAYDDKPQDIYGTKNILLVDDIELLVQIEKEALEKVGEFNVLVAHSSDEALRIVERERLDLVYMGLHMGGMDGDECCRIIKEKYGKDLPVVMVMHGGITNDFERCWQAGCDEIIVKPINHHLFIATTKKYLNIQSFRDPRLTERLIVKYGTDQQTVLSNYSVNLSTGGLFLAAEDILSVDTCFEIEFSLPGVVTPICCIARVAWVNDRESVFRRELPAGMGLQFIDISLEDVNALREYLAPGRLIALWWSAVRKRGEKEI